MRAWLLDRMDGLGSLRLGEAADPLVGKMKSLLADIAAEAAAT